MKTYEKLTKLPDIDLEKAREYAEMMEEKKVLEKRLEYLEELEEEHDEFREHLWETAGGKVLVIHDIPDDHLRNIVKHCASRGSIPRRIGDEYRKRFQEALPAPTEDDDLDLLAF